MVVVVLLAITATYVGQGVLIALMRRKMPPMVTEPWAGRRPFAQSGS